MSAAVVFGLIAGNLLAALGLLLGSIGALTLLGLNPHATANGRTIILVVWGVMSFAYLTAEALWCAGVVPAW